MFSIWLGWWNNVSNPSAKWRGRWWAGLWVRRLSVPQWDIIMTSVEVHLLKRLNTIVRRVLSCQMNILLSLISASALWSVFTLQIKCYCINFAPSKKKITKIILKKSFSIFWQCVTGGTERAWSILDWRAWSDARILLHDSSLSESEDWTAESWVLFWQSSVLNKTRHVDATSEDQTFIKTYTVSNKSLLLKNWQ